MTQEPRISLLIAEDHPANQKLLRTFFQPLPIDITLVKDGQQAIDAFIQKQFDLILMDLEMPNVSGIEAIKKIRLQESTSSNSRIPAVALTAHELKEKRKQVLIAGMDDCIEKPLTHNLLLTLIQRWLPEKIKDSDVLTLALTKNGKASDRTSLSDTQHVNQSIFDIDISLARANQNIELAKDLFDMLITDLSNINLIEQYRRNEQWSELKNYTHKLHGGCCYNGVPKLKQCCIDLETAIDNKQTDHMPLLCTNLINASQTLIQYKDAIKRQFQQIKSAVEL